MTPAPPRAEGTPARLLTIAGSDSGGGAGIQADLKTFMAFETFGMSVITGCTAQNTLGVQEISLLPAAFTTSQLASVLSDIGVDAIKTGMLASAAHVSALAAALAAHFPDPAARPPLVCDPVCAATSGHRLLPDAALASLKAELFPWATVLTPNVPEAELLAGWENGRIQSVEAMRECCRVLGRLGPEWVYLKGGHLPLDGGAGQGKVVADLLWEVETGKEYLTERRWIDSKNTHGTGCTLSSAIAAGLGKGMGVVEAVKVAGDYVAGAIAAAYPVGGGAGPVNHAFQLTSRPLPLPSLHSPQPLTDFLINYDPVAWSRFVNHPFTNGMARGDLPLPAFLHYIRQDYHYLKHYARAHSIAASKAPTLADMASSMEIVATVLKEVENHVRFCCQFGIAKAELEATEESVANMAYNRFVIDVSTCGDVLAGRVVTAPCLLGYGYMGRRLAKEPSAVDGGWVDRSAANATYMRWVEEYAGEWFQGAVQTGVDLLEKTVKESPVSRARMEELAEVFVTATKLEVEFWDEACRVGGVPTAAEQELIDAGKK